MSTRKILHKRGMRAQIPRLDEAEIAFTTDDKRLHIGTKDGNLQLMDEKDKREISAQLADKANKDEVQSLVINKADISYVDVKTSAIASGSPKDTYATLSALESAFPTGTTGIYVVAADGKWYYWNNSKWTPGGVYIATQNSEELIKGWFKSESYNIESTIRRNNFGYPVSPLYIRWPDRSSGLLTINYNADGSVKNMEATHSNSHIKVVQPDITYKDGMPTFIPNPIIEVIS